MGRVVICIAQKKLSSNAVKARALRKIDPLNSVVLEIVKRNPKISEKELRNKLYQLKSVSAIKDIDEEEVFYELENGKSKIAKISGLKDKISRAKKLLKK